MGLYTYSGPVLQYDRVIQSNWKGQTYAETKKQAISNLKYQFKTQAHMMPTVGGIKLYGNVEEKEN